MLGNNRHGFYTIPVIVITLLLMPGLKTSGQEPDLKRKVTVDYQNVSLESILQFMEKNYQVRFSYSNELIRSSTKITVHASNQSLDEVLGQVFKQAGLSFELVNGYLVLKPVSDENNVRPSIYTISGTVSDSATRELMIGAAVFDKSSGMGAITNNYGFYSLSLPSGSYVIQVSGLGYPGKTVSVELAGNVVMDFKIKQVPLLMKEIIINSAPLENKVLNALTGQNTIDPAAVQRQSAALGETDLLKSLDNLPGVCFQSEGSSYFSVRGGNHDQNLILLDEAPLYNPSHLLGLFTPIIPEAIKHAEVYKADFPVQYGGRLSSVVDIRAKDGNMKRFSGSASLGPVSSRFSLEGPFKKDVSSYFVSYRFSTFGAFVRSANPTVESFRFSDFTAKFNVRLGKKDRLYATLFSGKDLFINKPQGGRNGIGWDNTSATLRWSHVYGSRIFTNTTLYGSRYNYSLFTDYDHDIAWKSDVKNTTLKTELTWYITPKNEFKLGLSISGYFFNPGNYSSKNPHFDTLRVSRVNSSELIAYAGDEFKPLPWLRITVGARVSQWSDYGESFSILYNDQYQPVSHKRYPKGERYYDRYFAEPRASLSVRTGKNISLKVSYNRNIQNINQINNTISPFNCLDVWLPSGPNIKPQLAEVYDAGILAFGSGHSFEFSLDFYYKRLYNQIGYQYHAEMFLNPYLEGELRQGDGYCRGFEVMIQKTTGRLTGQISYGYINSELQIKGLNAGRKYLSHQDKPVDFSCTMDFRITARWTANFNAIYTSGMPLTTPTGFYEYRGTQVPVYNSQNNDRLPDYKRMDVGTQWRLNRKERTFTHYLSFTLYNFFSIRNYAFLNFNKMESLDGKFYVPADKTNPAKQVVTYRYIYSLVPSFTYSLRF